MKKINIAIFIMLFIIAGCDRTNNTLDEREQRVNELNPEREEHQTPGDQEINDQLGYVHYTQEQFDRNQDDDRVVTMDRNEMASMITRIILRNEAFNQVATLVTGDEVLIAYEIDDGMDENNAAEIARKTAESVMPRYFDIVVSDNPSLIPDIQSLHISETTRPNYQNTIDKIVEEMKTSPQGDE
ncbi:YhcN/YlaJ family sporulation lipoprotein [Virgibacillus sp. YIM 98842]|uniref:YhcN/YlaJ family sporulation lipoprotein n=1 Tax=Virgibacillus sp. YIM 98842 TaxID=2663533 RepID=UPI0013D9A198|nr:YhcN/YlaJ family sporulation lipoprotein [Virgibacillus sp. YIM 98842]